MSFFLNGIHVPHRKHTVDQSAVRMPIPKTITLPMSMHIGAPARPIVKFGDLVKVGTPVAEAGGAVSSPIFSGISGKVAKISDILLASGQTVPAVTIESDGEMTVDERIQVPVVDSREDLIEAIRMSGVVGLGGAGFPTHIKFNSEPSRVEELIINGAECEPYITSDSLTMTERADDMEYALKAMQKYFGIRKIIIGIEKNKKKAIATMQTLAKRIDGFSVCVLPSIYPQGGEKVLVYHTTKKTIPAGKLPIDVGCIVCNCTTLAAIGTYLKTGMPLVENVLPWTVLPSEHRRT